MKTLDKNWITENIIDFEYKKYLLLAYLQEVSSQFEEQKLYPALSDLIFHYRNLIRLRESKNMLFESFPERMVKPDLEQFKITYEKMVGDDEIMHEIEQIINYSIPKIEYQLSDGKKIYDFVEEHLHISPVGILPLHPSEGYLMLKNAGENETRVYEYQITIFDNPNERLRGIHVNYISSYGKSLINTAEAIKSDIIRQHKKMPNPATYVIETDIKLPFMETFLPIAKRILVKYVASGE
jgi:hypothetical protein